MEFIEHEVGGTRFIEASPGGRFMHTARDAARLVEACLSHRVRLAVVSPASQVQFSTNFRHFAEHEARAGHLGICPTREDAVQWLVATAPDGVAPGAQR